MSITTTDTTTEIQEKIAADLADIGDVQLTLGDLIRAGSAHTVKKEGWGSDGEACALSAAGVAAQALGLIGDEE